MRLKKYRILKVFRNFNSSRQKLLNWVGWVWHKATEFCRNIEYLRIYSTEEREILLSEKDSALRQKLGRLVADPTLKSGPKNYLENKTKGETLLRI